MARPNTYLLSPPPGETNPYGNGMMSSDLIRGLRRCNPNICVPDPDHYAAMGWHYPGYREGHTSIWLGQPPSEVDAFSHIFKKRERKDRKEKVGKKITSFHLGMVPEWTQIGPDGQIIARGWRDVFKRVIAAGAATKRKIERVFRVNLDYDGSDGLCPKCRMGGMETKANGAGGLCSMHDNARKSAAQMQALKKEVLCQS